MSCSSSLVPRLSLGCRSTDVHSFPLASLLGGAMAVPEDSRLAGDSPMAKTLRKQFEGEKGTFRVEVWGQW